MGIWILEARGPRVELPGDDVTRWSARVGPIVKVTRRGFAPLLVLFLFLLFPSLRDV